MSSMIEVDLGDILLSNASFGPREIELITHTVHDDFAQFGRLKEVVQQLESQEARTPASAVKLGVALYILGRYEDSISTLSNSDSGAVAFYYMGKSYFALNNHVKATESYEAATQAGYDKDFCLLGIIEAKRYSKDLKGAMDLLDTMFGPIEQSAEYLYQRAATIAAIGDNPYEAIALYERAVEVDECHAGALFGLGLENDRRGNDREAIDFYQRAANLFPTNVGTLLNLGLLYEDAEQYDHARRCYQRILDVYPDRKAC